MWDRGAWAGSGSDVQDKVQDNLEVRDVESAHEVHPTSAFQSGLVSGVCGDWQQIVRTT